MSAGRLQRISSGGRKKELITGWSFSNMTLCECLFLVAQINECSEGVRNFRGVFFENEFVFA